MTLRVRIIGFTLASVVALASANAADIYTPAPAPVGPGGYKDEPWLPTWAGVYVGINGGYGWSANSDQLRDFSNGPGNLFNGLDPTGGFGGGQIGYNWQRGYFVFGVEADFQGGNISDKATWTLATSKSDVDWFGTVRGRLGYAIGPTLVYATGGFAYGHVDNAEIGAVAYRANDVSTGWVVGGGVEYKIAPAWSVKGEYQFIDLGRNDPESAAGVKLSSFPGVIVHDDEFHTIRFGVNYHFGQDYAPLK